MKKLDILKEHLHPGRTYRRADLLEWSHSIDRHLQQLVNQGVLKKLRAGLYYYPKKSVFGDVPADNRQLVRTFLKDDRFLLTSLDAYNSLGVGTTQLYNQQIVYNHKRHGKFVLGGRNFDFRMKHHFPLHTVTEEFLLVDLVNNLNELAEDREEVLNKVQEKAHKMDQTRLARAIREYADTSTRKFFTEALANV